MMIRDKSVIQDETEQKLDEADQAAAANPSRYAEADVFARGSASKRMSRKIKIECFSWLDIDFSRRLHIQDTIHRALHHSNLIILSQIAGGRRPAAVWLFFVVGRFGDV